MVLRPGAVFSITFLLFVDSYSFISENKGQIENLNLENGNGLSFNDLLLIPFKLLKIFRWSYQQDWVAQWVLLSTRLFNCHALSY